MPVKSQLLNACPTPGPHLYTINLDPRLAFHHLLSITVDLFMLFLILAHSISDQINEDHSLAHHILKYPHKWSISLLFLEYYFFRNRLHEMKLVWRST